ncbi:unnamed protein product [Heterosigma akashiwo]
MWGEAPQGPAEVYEVFARYVEGRVPYLPWCETPLQAETQTIQPMLAALNRHGFLTINSQPRVNGARSGDRTFGWGGPGGRVYQKAYVEWWGWGRGRGRRGALLPSTTFGTFDQSCGT